MSAIPCPQAARSPGVLPTPQSPMQTQIEAIGEMPRPIEQVQALPQALIDPTTRWPYHLPSYNGVDCLWWSMLFRATYHPTDLWVRRVAAWAGPIARLEFQDRSVPSVQGYAFVELGDCVLVVIPGTSSDTELLSYFMTHSLRLIADGPVAETQMNSTWVARGGYVARQYRGWFLGRERKPIIVVGHSAGGAYGAYVAFQQDDDIDKLTTLVTFGAPIWGTPSLDNYYRTHFTTGDRIRTGILRPQIIEFTNVNDFVSTLPPPWALVDLIVPGYALAGRPVYSRLANLLALVDNNAPAPSTTPTTVESVARNLLQLMTGGGFNSTHASPMYTASAQRWAVNDPTIAANSLTREREGLINILLDMNEAGVGA